MAESRIVNHLTSTTPAGQPVSRFLIWDPTADNLRHLAEIIDRIHGTGDLPECEIRLLARLEVRARYVPGLTTGRDRIDLWRGTGRMELTLLHELGHLLDFRGIGAGNEFSSLRDPLFRKWKRAINRTQAVAELESLLRQAESGIIQSGKRRRLSREYPAYLLKSPELFARSYTQYVALRSGQQSLMDQLDLIRYNHRDVYRFRQWENADFEPVFEALEKLLRRLGWIR
jgi:hypothetical protein